jgi:hypothetical protein
MSEIIPGAVVRVVVLERAGEQGRAVLPDGTPFLIAGAGALTGRLVAARVITVMQAGGAALALGKLEAADGAEGVA